MADNPTDVMGEDLASGTGGVNEHLGVSEVDDLDFEELPAETDEEIVAGLAGSEEDVQAGRVRPLRALFEELIVEGGMPS